MHHMRYSSQKGSQNQPPSTHIVAKEGTMVHSIYHAVPCHATPLLVATLCVLTHISCATLYVVL
jgi:hypothetical protein